MIKKRCNITARDIKLGKRNECDRCPGARAIKRATKLFPSVRKYQIELYPTEASKPNLAAARVARMPPALHTFISRFDAGKSVKPMSFILEYQP